MLGAESGKHMDLPAGCGCLQVHVVLRVRVALLLTGHSHLQPGVIQCCCRGSLEIKETTELRKYDFLLSLQEDS